ncbi:MAG: hypothetical protein KBS81_02660, partial [Spirochaetales bacterium]|nr:hypothetical protein [Candidatus Physcosoma equi]
MKKESALPRLPLGVHKLFNYLLLPVSIGYGVYASYMHLEPLMAFSLKSFLDALLLVCLLFPFSSVLLNTITFFT